ncbi:helix-turn-helix domain-containing protein [Streptomyces sp. HUAS TT7]|uniref:helix-turn-helix domain-containing protein n=1 Tax=Streptomyces sp. HUAS TT7 TaxID=3447507 RepID=UPI003F65DDF4
MQGTSENVAYHSLFRLLELLAGQAPARGFDEPVARARAEGVDPGRLALLKRARTLALDVNELFVRGRQREAGLSALVDTAKELALAHDLEALLKVVARRARLLLGLDVSWVSVRESAHGWLAVCASDGHSAPHAYAHPVREGAGNAAIARGGPFWTPDYLDDDRFPHVEAGDDMVRTEGLRAVLAVPLYCDEGETALGVLYVAHRAVRNFSPCEINLVVSLADLAAVAIGRAHQLDRAHDEISELEFGTWRAMDFGSAAHRMLDAQNRLTELALRGGPPQELAERAVAELGGGLLIRDASGTALASAGDFPDVAEAELERGAFDAHAARAPVASAGLWFAPATAGDELLGTLVLAPGGPAADGQPPMMRAVAQAVSVLLRMRDSTVLAEQRMRDELFRELLGGSVLSADRIGDRARWLGIDLSLPHVVVVIRSEGDGAREQAARWAAAHVRRRAGLRLPEGDGVVLLLPGSDPAAAARDVRDQLTAVLGRPVSVGAAGPAEGPSGVAPAHREARRCLDAVVALGDAGGTASPRELGFLGLLLAEQPDAAAFIASTVGPLLDYDAHQATALVATLEAYFGSGGSPTRAAEILHVHPNTVSRRLERITELLGPRWQEPGRAVDVQLALRLHRARHAIRNRDTSAAATGRSRPLADEPSARNR